MPRGVPAVRSHRGSCSTSLGLSRSAAVASVISVLPPSPPAPDSVPPAKSSNETSERHAKNDSGAMIETAKYRGTIVILSPSQQRGLDHFGGGILWPIKGRI